MKDFLESLLAAVETRSQKEFLSSDWTSAQWGCALAGEVGELCNLIKKEWRDGPQMSIAARHDLYDSIAYEMADVLIYLCALANSRGIPLAKITTIKFNMTSRRAGYKTMLPE